MVEKAPGRVRRPPPHLLPRVDDRLSVMADGGRRTATIVAVSDTGARIKFLFDRVNPEGVSVPQTTGFPRLAANWSPEREAYVYRGQTVTVLEDLGRRPLRTFGVIGGPRFYRAANAAQAGAFYRADISNGTIGLVVSEAPEELYERHTDGPDHAGTDAGGAASGGRPAETDPDDHQRDRA